MVDEVGKTGAISNQKFSQKGMQLSQLKENKQIYEFFKKAGLSDGNYVMFGRLTPMEAETASLESAAEATGFNGITVTFTNSTVESPIPLSAEAVKVVTGATAGVGG